MILLVEDEAIPRYAFARILRGEGHEVKEAANGEEALELLGQHQIDLVITDLVMPHLDGFALVSQTHQKWPSIPIIVMSGYAAQYAADALAESLTEFLPKPIDPSILIATVERLLPKASK